MCGDGPEPESGNAWGGAAVRYGERGGARRSVSMLVPLDGSALSETVQPDAAATLIALAGPAPALLYLAFIVDPVQAAEAYLAHVADRVRGEHPGERLMVTTSVLGDRDFAGALLQLAASPPAPRAAGAAAGGRDLIAMATHGRTGLARWALGSIAECDRYPSDHRFRRARPVSGWRLHRAHALGR